MVPAAWLPHLLLSTNCLQSVKLDLKKKQSENVFLKQQTGQTCPGNFSGRHPLEFFLINLRRFFIVSNRLLTVALVTQALN